MTQTVNQATSSNQHKNWANTDQQTCHAVNLSSRQIVPCWNTQPAMNRADGLVARRKKINSLAASETRLGC